MAEYVLDIMQPYPGDSKFLQVGVRHRFDVFAWQNSDFYWIYDHLTCQGCLIWSVNLKNPYFCLGEWYAHWRSQKNKLSERPKQPWTMGNAYGYNATLVLHSGIPTLYGVWVLFHSPYPFCEQQLTQRSFCQPCLLLAWHSMCLYVWYICKHYKLEHLRVRVVSELLELWIQWWSSCFDFSSLNQRRGGLVCSQVIGGCSPMCKSPVYSW